MRGERRGFQGMIRVATVLAVAGLLGCWFASQVWAQRESSHARVEKLALLPIFKGVLTYNVQESLNCAVCRLVEDAESNVPDADRILTEMVQKSLERKFGYAVIHPSKVKSVYDAMPKDETVDTPIGLAQRLGRALGASHMMAGNVWRFRERVGGSMGVETPASVAFLLYMVDPSSGAVLWKGSFNETQRPLSENVLDAPAFFKRGAKWLTAEELARNGVNEMFRKISF